MRGIRANYSIIQILGVFLVLSGKTGNCGGQSVCGKHGLLPYTCSYCPKRFNHKAHRDLHVKARHTGEKSCHCDICGRGFSCVSVLKMHRLTHFDKTFICDICRKAFHHACHLTRHKLVHSGDKPFHCDVCGKSYRLQGMLWDHRYTHSDEKLYSCSVCSKSFKMAASFSRHRSIHNCPHKLSEHEEGEQRARERERDHQDTCEL
uniref:C2H2-type domain-containing protein n=1 Tax=Kryptolebias marmoratus TaxID=37003 RepID=A0A3Q3ACR6_KRYMA